VPGATRFGVITAGENGALVFAVGLQRGEQKALVKSFFYDEELRLVHLRRATCRDVVRIWSGARISGSAARAIAAVDSGVVRSMPRGGTTLQSDGTKKMGAWGAPMEKRVRTGVYRFAGRDAKRTSLPAIGGAWNLEQVAVLGRFSEPGNALGAERHLRFVVRPEAHVGGCTAADAGLARLAVEIGISVHLVRRILPGQVSPRRQPR
jgi:hypothetical protein